MICRLSALAALLLVFSCSKPDPPKRSSLLRVVVFHTADLHGRVDRLASLASYIAKERRKLEASGVGVLHVDAGDFFQGTPEGDLTKGRVVVDAFNEMGVDALVPGNHDFDLGPAVTEALAKAARFPFLAANVKPAPWARASLVRRDLRIEILGLAPDAMDRLSTRRAREGLSFKSAADAVVAHRWAPGVARLVVTHLGVERDRSLPLQGIAAVLGGHTHVAAVEPLPGGAILLHPGSHGESIGRLELEIDSTGAVRSARAEVTEVPDGRAPEIEEIVEARTGEIRRTMAERVGRLEADLPRGGPDFDGMSSPLGNHIADLAREAGGAEAALILRSSIRASLFAGVVRRRDLYEATPFPDTIISVTVTGAKLRAALERGVAGEERLLIEVSGITLTYDRQAPSGKRITRAEVAGEPINVRRPYRIATLSFGFLTGSDSRDTGRTLLEAQMEFLRVESPFRPDPFKARIAPKP
jgi:5'-nucleotidase/UDP-sugar diphosphatase